jgi:hypothetical protein
MVVFLKSQKKWQTRSDNCSASVFHVGFFLDQPLKILYSRPFIGNVDLNSKLLSK